MVFSLLFRPTGSCWELTAHTPIRARRRDGYMRLLAGAGPILCVVIPTGSHYTDQDPAGHPVSPQANPLRIKLSALFSGRRTMVLA